MKSTRWLSALALSMTGIAGMAVGCGDSDGAGGSGGTGTTVTSTSKATVTVAASTTSSTMGDGNDSFATAEQVDATANVQTPGDLFDINEDEDFFTFDGTAGDQLLIQVTAHTGTDLQSEDFIDPVVTLYDASMTQIAFNDDPFPRLNSQDSSLFTVLPATGKYYVKLEDFHHFDPAAPPPMVPPDGTYTIYIGGINPAYLVAGAEPNDTSAMATVIPMTKSGANYQSKGPFSKFTAGSAVDWFSIAIPSDIAFDPGTRPEAWFAFTPGTKDGSGSTSELSSVQLIDAATMNVIAESHPDQETGDKTASVEWDAEIFAPVVPGADYFLKVTRSGAGSTNDFSFISYLVDVDSNPLESTDISAGSNNDTAANAETIPTMLDTATMVDRGFIEGDLNLGAADVDQYRVAVSAHTKVSAFCASQSSGSGNRSLKVTIFRGDGTTVITSATEVADVGADVTGVMGAGFDVPAGETEVVVKIEASTPDATVTGRFYRCGVSLFDPQ